MNDHPRTEEAADEYDRTMNSSGGVRAFDQLYSRMADMERELAAVTTERDALLKMADRMCGDHYAPGDCYSTGPLTGGVEDSLCPSCQYLTFRAALRGKAAS